MAGTKEGAQKRMERERNDAKIDPRMDERAPIVYSEDSRFNVPASIRESDPEHVYAYIPYKCGGKELEDDVYNAIEKDGFIPVRASEHPALKRRYDLGLFAKKDEDDLIKTGGQLLMKRTVEAQKRSDIKYDAAIAQQNYMRELYSQDPVRPRMIEDRRYTGAFKG